MSYKKKVNPEEDELIERAKKGDKNALSELYEKSHKQLACVLISKYGYFESLQDVIQTSYYKAFKALNRFKSDSSFASWLVTIAVNTKRDWHRFENQNEVRKASSLNEMLEDGFDAADVNAVDITEQGKSDPFNVYKKLLRLKRRLTKEHRIVFNLELIKGLTSKQISERLNLPLGTILSRSFYLKRKLRKLIKKTKWGKELQYGQKL